MILTCLSVTNCLKNGPGNSRAESVVGRGPVALSPASTRPCDMSYPRSDYNHDDQPGNEREDEQAHLNPAGTHPFELNSCEQRRW